MKALKYAALVLLIAALVVSLLQPTPAKAQVTFPARGGTGTSTIPTLGQVLVGQSNGTYAPQATSTLNISPNITATYPLQYASGLLSLAFGTTTANSWSLHQVYSSLFSTNASTTNATSTTLAVTGSFNFLGTVITNVSTWFAGLFDTRLATKTTADLVEGANLYFTDARARSAVSEAITGIDYSSGTGVFSQTAGYTIPKSASTTEWAEAYGWGDHALAGYLTSITETDPVFSASDAFGIAAADIANWDTAFGWGNHAAAGYLTSTAGDWTGTFDGREGAFYLANSFSTTSADHWLTLNRGAAFSTTSADVWLGTKSTSNLTEGTNLYYTDARVLTFLDGLSKGYFFSTTSAAYWKTQTDFFSTTSAAYWLTQQDTGDLAEGSNLYFTDERGQDAVGGILVDSSRLDFTYSDATPSITADVVADSIGDTQLAFNTGQNLTTASSPAFAGLTLSGLSDGCIEAASGILTSTGVGCGTGTGTAGLGTTSPWTGSGVAYRVSDGSVSTAATTSLTASSPLALSQPIAVIGSSASALSITNAAADGSTKGAASFAASDFNASSGNITLDYTNAQAASASAKGFLTSADWTTFNSKESALTFSYPLTRSIDTISLAFGTTSSNTWGGTQTFTNAPVLGSLTGAVSASSGTLTAGTLSVANGGTGQTSYTAGNLLYADTANSIAGLTNVATGRVLISQGAAAAPIWSETATLNTSVITPILTTNNNTSLANFRTVSATGIGAQLNAASLQLSGSTNVQFRTIFNGSSATTLTAGTSYSGTIWGAQVATEATSGTHPLIANAAIKSPVITDGTAATTDLTSLYIEGAPTGITPTNLATAMWVDAGIVRIDQTLAVGTSSPYARLAVHAASADTYSGTLFAVASSTAAFATTTHFNVMASGNVGVGSTSPGTILSLGSSGNYINLSNTATSTFAFGIESKGMIRGVIAFFTGLINAQAGILVQASGYINFGTSVGSSGYGIRDNAGTMEFKNSGGSWTALGGSTDLSVRVYQSGVTSVTSSWDSLAFAAENFDTDTMHDNASNNTRITFTTAGKYHIGGCFYASTNNVVGARVRLNGTTVLATQKQGNSGGPEAACIDTIYSFSASDYVELQGYSGSTQNSSGDSSTHFWAYKIN